MANKSTAPLYEKIHLKNSIPRAVELIILFLLIFLLAYHLISLKQHGIPSLLAFLCESCFAFTWIIVINCKWNQVKYIQYPDQLSELLVITLLLHVTLASGLVFYTAVLVIGTHTDAHNMHVCVYIFHFVTMDIIITIFMYIVLI